MFCRPAASLPVVRLGFFFAILRPWGPTASVAPCFVRRVRNGVSARTMAQSRVAMGCPLCHAAGSRVLARCEPGGLCCLLGGFSAAWCFGISHRIPAPLLPEMDLRVGDSCRVNLCGANKFICWMAQMQECLISDALGWRVGFYYYTGHRANRSSAVLVG